MQHEDSCFVSIVEPEDDKYSIEDSPLFWNITEWDKIFKVNPSYAMNHEHYVARQAAMQWAEEYYEQSIEKNIEKWLIKLKCIQNNCYNCFVIIHTIVIRRLEFYVVVNANTKHGLTNLKTYFQNDSN